MAIPAIDRSGLFESDESASQVEIFTKHLEPANSGRKGPKRPKEEASRSRVSGVGSPEADGPNPPTSRRDSKDEESCESTLAQDQPAEAKARRSQEAAESLHWAISKTSEQVEQHLRTDNQFRAFVIRQQWNSHSRLSISKRLFEFLNSSCGLSSQFEDVLTYFGSRDLEVEVAAPRLRFIPLASRAEEPACPRGFECMYGLRFMEKNNRGDPRRIYSLRQMAICSRLETDRSLSTWVLVTPPPNAMVSFRKQVAEQVDPTAAAIFSLHLNFFNFAISSWRPYLVHLSKEVNQHANTVLVAVPTGNGPVSFSGCGDMQRLKQLGDQMIDTTVALSSTRSAVSRLTEDYRRSVVKSKSQDRSSPEGDENDVSYQLTDNLRELDWLLQQTEGLRQKLSGTSHLVSSLIAQASARSLEDLGMEAREENSQMHVLTKRGTQDAAAVKVLSIMALIFLPATVVSNFFSTSFVDTNSPSDSPRKLIVLSNWWIFLVTVIPLTAVTLYLWWIFTGIQAQGSYPQWCQRVRNWAAGLISKESAPADEESNAGFVRPATTVYFATEKP